MAFSTINMVLLAPIVQQWNGAKKVLAPIENRATKFKVLKPF